MVKRTLSVTVDPPRPAKKRKYTRRAVSTAIGPSRDYKLLKNKQRVTMRYGDTFNLNPGALGSPATYVLSCNGLYDPDITGTGHQPRGFDELMQLYDHYLVERATIECWFNHDVSTGTVFMINCRDSPSVFTLRDSHLENAHSTMTVKSSEAGGAYLRMTVDPAKFLSLSKNEDNLRGNTAANPSESCYWHISAFPQDKNLDTANVYVTVRITYDTVLIEPKEPGTS